MAEIEIPTQADAEAISALGKKTFEETFVGVAYYTQELVDGYTVKAFDPALIRREMNDSKIRYFLLRLGGQLVGYAKLVEREPAACMAGKNGIYLERIYLAKDFHRRGLGTKLMTQIYQEALNRGYEWIWLSVWEFNPQAYQFYLKHGFHRAGEWGWEFESNGKKYVDRDYIMAVRVPVD